MSDALRYARIAAADYGVTVDAICSRARPRNVTAARWRVWEQLRLDGLSLPQIAAATGHNHTSVLYGLRELARREGRAPVQKRQPIKLLTMGEIEVMCNLAAMRAKHAREVAQRY